jgi:hypothetical protein
MRRGVVEKDRVKQSAGATGQSNATGDGFFGAGGAGAAAMNGTGVTASRDATPTGATSRQDKTRNSKMTQSSTPIGMGNKKSRRQSVETVLEMFRNGQRDPRVAYQKIKEAEGEDISAVIDALDQLSEILCQATYFKKAYEILSEAIKDIKGNPVLHELVARLAFVMESFDKCINHNKRAIELKETDTDA